MGRGENNFLYASDDFYTFIQPHNPEEEILSMASIDWREAFKEYGSLITDLSEEKDKVFRKIQIEQTISDRLRMSPDLSQTLRDQPTVEDSRKELLNLTRDIRSDPLEVAFQFLINTNRIAGQYYKNSDVVRGSRNSDVHPSLRRLFVYRKNGREFNAWLQDNFHRYQNISDKNFKAEDTGEIVDAFYNKFYPLEFRRKFPNAPKYFFFDRIHESGEKALFYNLKQSLQSEMEALIDPKEVDYKSHFIESSPKSKIHKRMQMRGYSKTRHYTNGLPTRERKYPTSCGRGEHLTSASSDLSKRGLCKNCWRGNTMEDAELFTDTISTSITADSSQIDLSTESKKALWTSELPEGKRYLVENEYKDYIKAMSNVYLKNFSADKVKEKLGGKVTINLWDTDCQLNINDDGLVEGIEIK